MTQPAFQRYIGIDYSGAETPDSSLKGLRVYEGSRESMPVEVEPPPSPRKYWTRRGLAEWLTERLSEDVPAIVGIDHGFSFPLLYFEVHHLDGAEAHGDGFIGAPGNDGPPTPPGRRTLHPEGSCFVTGIHAGMFRRRQRLSPQFFLAH